MEGKVVLLKKKIFLAEEYQRLTAAEIVASLLHEDGIQNRRRIKITF